MLRRLLMKTGSTPGGPPLDIPLSGVTVFVGPNNSGKSRALSEIEQWLRNANPPPGLVVKSVEFEPWSATAIKDILDILKIDPTDGESVGTNHVIIETLNAQTNAMFRSQINRQALEREAQNPGAYRNNYVTLLSLFTLKLDGKNRLALSESQPAGDLQKTAPNHLAKLFVANDLRARLRQIVFEAFGKYLVIDPTNIGHLRLRLSSRAPVDEREEKGWDSVAQAFHRLAVPIESASDGVKAFVGMLSTIIAGNPR